MKTVDSRNGIVWLDVKQFAERQHKDPETIRLWCVQGFIVELGLLLRRDCTGHWKIGIPPTHAAYLDLT